MAGVLQHLRSATLNKRPNPASMVDGQLAINYASGSPGAFFKDSNGNLVKVGPVHVGATAPNVSPASGGTAGNSLGEQWLDTSGGTYVFKIWDGAAWRSEAGEFVNVTGDTMTGALGVIAGSASTPGLFISGDANTGIYSPSADQLSITTGGTERLRIDSTGQIEAASLGTGASPTFTFTGDPNTGIYSPGADQLALTTSGSERARIDSSGRLLVNTSSASGTNTLFESSSTTANAANVALVKQNSGTADQAGQQLHFYNFGPANTARAADTEVGSMRFYGSQPTSGAAQEMARITCAADLFQTGTNTSGRLVFSTTANGASSPTERMRIDSSGRVGIGTAILPGNKLTVGNGNSSADNSIVKFNTGDAATPALTLSNWTGSATLNGPRIGFDNSGRGSFILGCGDGVNDFYLGNATSRFWTVDASGRLLVGTSSTSANTTLLLQGYNGTQTNSGGHLRLAIPTTTPANDANLGTVLFSDSEHTNCAIISADRDGGTWSSSSKPTRLVFSTTANGVSSLTEHYRITSAGYLSFTSNVGLYNLRQTTYNQNSNAVLGVFGSYNGDAVNNGAVYNIEWKMNGNASGQFWYANYITQGGSRTLGAYCTGTAWTNSSDIANKEEIVDTRYGLDTVLSLRPVDFRWKSQRDEEGNGKPDIGFIAQEMEQIIPEVVTGAEGNKGISYGNLVSVLAKAIQEQQAMIAGLQAEVAALKAA